ncbi:MAG: hypothetical protein ACR652_07610 [Methylocystis sp.]|uniref:hypothetical protein n=1 Tax=Methylocystis sp. TaxID=1911079 RepID=UPI003DA580FA
MTPSATLSAILSKLDPADAAFVRDLAARADATDARSRLDRRDDAIRDTVATFYPDMPPSAAAKALARDLGRVLTGGPISSGDLRAALRQVASLNRDRPIGWRQVLNILDGDRGRETLQLSRLDVANQPEGT